MSTPNNQKKSYGRPKSAEPGSPLLRRALSPDRLHPRSAENKTSISPLANSVVKVTPRVTIAQTSHSEASDESGDSFKDASDTKTEKKVSNEQKPDYSKLSHAISINLGNVGMTNSCGSTQLPRIAEEKDSPTGSKGDDYSSKDALPSEKTEKAFAKSTETERVHNDRRDQDSKVFPSSKTTEQSTNKIEENTKSVDNPTTPQVRSTASHKQSQSNEKSSQASQKTSQSSEKGSQAIASKAASHGSEKSSQAATQKAPSHIGDKCSQASVQKSSSSEKSSHSSQKSQSNEKIIPQAVSQKSHGEKSSHGTQKAQSSEKGVGHKSSEQKTGGKSSEANPEGRKTLKKHKVETSEDGSSAHDAGGSGKDKKNA